LGLKKLLQDNLSLSAKLFLRGLLQNISPRKARPGKYSLETPSLSETEFDLATTLAKGSPTSHSQRAIQASIIIPVFNKAEFTWQCLGSLVREIDFSKVEIIVVDNASTDNTEAVLAHFADYVRVISNERNAGFVDACNQGAAVAKGKYLVFLNNDTTVLPDWLNSLIETIEADAATGAVGSMFLYPDGSIQEAGGIVWQNGEAHHYGWGAAPNDRRFNFAREVDYCSAASLLIKKEIFDRLGGFDRRFAPAYYEDIDLCFGVRSLGYKVIYQPMSRLVHFEGGTAGADTKKGFKRFQITNRGKFVEKWRATLEQDQLPQDLKQVTAASDRNRYRPRVVVFDERVPTPDRDAGSLRMLMILKTLAAWSHVTFVPFNRPERDDYEQILWQQGIETADAVEYRKLLKHQNVKAAIVSRPSMGSAFIHRIRRIDPNVTVVFDMVDTHFVRFQREYEISGKTTALSEAKRYRKIERKLAQASDLVWCASPEDKQAMERESPNTRIEVVPTIHELRDPGKVFADRQNLLFIGNFAHRPNEDAVLFFLREVYPLVRQRLPNVHLDLIGDCASDAIKAYNSDEVRILGFVPDVEPYLRNARVFIAPLRFGAGIKGKVGEAMAYGIPVVTTSIGAEGFGATHGVDIMLADDPASFAEATTRLYGEDELWQRLATNSRLLIKKRFAPQVVAETINRSIGDVGRQKSGGKPAFPTTS
jgi:GT2 family glycosyltransferase/glycosyltransferase involved in cell wall biosynthesis